MRNYALSKVMPVYNSGKVFPEAAVSLLSQSFSDFEMAGNDYSLIFGHQRLHKKVLNPGINFTLKGVTSYALRYKPTR